VIRIGYCIYNNCHEQVPAPTKAPTISAPALANFRTRFAAATGPLPDEAMDWRMTSHFPAL